MHTPPSNEPKFVADRYLESRPLYPAEIYTSLVNALGKAMAPRTFLDLGCGTGQSTFSFAALSLSRGLSTRGIAIDVDAKMLETAARASRPSPLADFPIDYRVAPAEALPLADRSVDFVLIGSAVHWFRIEEAKKEIERVLKPGGFLFVYEYQFPKAVDHPELNEWIRRKFNTEWKAPTQVPRGKLVEILAPFSRDGKHWSPLEESRPAWITPLSLEAFLGNLFSQSRYLHAEAVQTDPSEYQQEIARQIQPYFASGSLVFDFKPRAFLARFVLT